MSDENNNSTGDTGEAGSAPDSKTLSAENEKLKSQLEKLATDLINQSNAYKRIEGKLKRYETERSEELERKTKEGSEADRIKALEAKNADWQAQFSELQSKYDSEVQRNGQFVKTQRLRESVGTMIREEAFADFLAVHGGDFELTDDLKLSLKEKGGTVEHYVAELLKQKPYFARDTSARGAGAARANSGTKEGGPFDPSGKSRAEIRSWFSENRGTKQARDALKGAVSSLSSLSDD